MDKQGAEEPPTTISRQPAAAAVIAALLLCACDGTLSFGGQDGFAPDLSVVADVGKTDTAPRDGGRPDRALADAAADATPADTFSLDAASPDVASPDVASPDVLSPDVASPDVLSPDVASPDVLSPDVLSPDVLSPDVLSPDVLSPDVLSPDVLSPDVLSPDVLSPDVLSPDSASPPDFGGPLYTGSFPQKPSFGFRWGDLRVKGVPRRVRLYFPVGMAQKPPLVIVFHGTGAAGEDAIWGAAANELADAHKVLVAAPNARALSQGDWDNHTPGQVYWETHPNLSPQTNNDLQVVQAIIAEAVRAYDADPKRVYVAGFSTGGFFAHFAAFALPNQIAAFASNAGGLVRCATTSGCVFTGSGSTCATLAQSSGWCSCSGTDKPSPVPTSGRKVPGYIGTADNDGVVSPYYSCTLASRMAALGYTTSLNIRSGGGHSWPPHFLPNAWSFLSSHVLP